MRIPCWVWILALIVISCLLSSLADAFAVGPVINRLATGTLRENNVTWQIPRVIWLYVLSAIAMATAIAAASLAVHSMKRSLIRRVSGYVVIAISILAGLNAIGCFVLSVLFGTFRV